MNTQAMGAWRRYAFCVAYIEYVRSRLAKDATEVQPDGEVAFAYELLAPKSATEKAPASSPAAHPDAGRQGP